jgi:hypothetical protein
MPCKNWGAMAGYFGLFDRNTAELAENLLPAAVFVQQ